MESEIQPQRKPKPEWNGTDIGLLITLIAVFVLGVNYICKLLERRVE